MVRRLLLSSVALAAMTAGAAAADLPNTKEAPVYTPPPPAFIWTGFYIGADVGGYGASQSAVADPYPSPGFGAPAIDGAGVPGFGNLPTTHNLNSVGALGGIHVGYNYQFSPYWLVGIEGDADYLHRTASDTEVSNETFTTPGPAFDVNVRASNYFLASLRGRIGLVAGQWLLYATGGGAWTETSYSATDTGLIDEDVGVYLPGVGSTTSFSSSHIGYVVGTGVEWMLAPNWVLRAEYLHYGFSGTSGTLPLVFSADFGSCAAGQCNWAVHPSSLQFNTGRVGISYLFGAPPPPAPPVVAKY